MATEQPHLDADSNITNDAFNSSSSNFGEPEIPDRIKCIVSVYSAYMMDYRLSFDWIELIFYFQVPISVRPSLIDPKNTGLFVDKAVSAGDILLKVEKPLFAIVGGSMFLVHSFFVYHRLLAHLSFDIRRIVVTSDKTNICHTYRLQNPNSDPCLSNPTLDFEYRPVSLFILTTCWQFWSNANLSTVAWLEFIYNVITD